MADELRPYIFETSSSAGAAGADVAVGEDVKEGSDSSGIPLLTISDINADMLEACTCM